MSTSQYPSIPTPGGTLPQLLATVTALQQAVNLLIVNAQATTTQNLTKKTQVFAQQSSVDSMIGTVNASFSTFQTTTSEQLTTVNSNIATLQANVATVQASTTTNTAKITTISADLTAGIGVTGALNGGVLTIQGAQTLDGAHNYNVLFPGSQLVQLSVPTNALVLGSVGSAQLAPNSATADATASSAGTTATANLTLGVAGDVIVIASYTGTGVATPAGTGALIVKVDGVDKTVLALSSAGGNVLPATGFFVLTGVALGVHTFAVRAEFSTGPTDLSGVSVVAFALMR